MSAALDTVGVWARCNACGGTGIGRIVAAPQQSARENA